MNKKQAIKLLSKDTSINEISKLRNKGLSQREIIDTIQEAIDICIVSTEKQIAKKLTHEATIQECHTCPNCKNVLDRFNKTLYCWFCGQKLDWNVGVIDISTKL